jgi:tight adherence protein C
MVAMNAVGALAVVLGAVLGLGLWLVTSAVPRLGRPRLVESGGPESGAWGSR